VERTRFQVLNGGEYEDDSRLGYCAVQSRISLLMSKTCLLPPVSGLFTQMMEAVNTSETSTHFYETTWRNIPEGCHLLRNNYMIRIGHMSF
jgi:hypothetical protein